VKDRFAGAPRVALGARAGELEAFVADRFLLRFAGLTRLAAEEIRPLLFPRCRSIHTFWMRAPIDVVWLALSEEEDLARVLAVVSDLPPRRRAGAPRKGAARKRIAALELTAGSATALDLSAGDSLQVSFEGRSPIRS
jgi:uncharacterized membrane protein (UPF0127 family)